MTGDGDHGDTPLLDEWRAEIGDQAIADIVADARSQIAAGITPGFSDRDELEAYLQRQPRRTA